MATSSNCISKADIEDSALSYTSSVIAILTFCFAVGATIRAHINDVHHSCSRFADFKAVVKSFEQESKWIQDVLNHEKQEPLQAQRASSSPTSRPRLPSIVDTFFETARGSQSEADREARLSAVVEAVADGTILVEEPESISVPPNRPPSVQPDERRKRMRDYLWREARKRKFVLALTENFRRNQIEMQKVKDEPVYKRLLADLKKSDGKLRDIVKVVEHDSSASVIATTSLEIPWRNENTPTNDFQRRQQNRGGDQIDNSSEVDENLGNDEVVVGIGTLKWWLGFDIDWRWLWPQKARMSKQWLLSREDAMVLKEQRAALSSQVMFAQLTIVQGQIADRVLSESEDSQLIQELAKLRDELISQEGRFWGPDGAQRYQELGLAS